jgi:hypothetical protein
MLLQEMMVVRSKNLLALQMTSYFFIACPPPLQPEDDIDCRSSSSKIKPLCPAGAIP